MKVRRAGIWVAAFAVAFALRADEQLWNDGGPSGLWNLSDLNWDADAAWVDGNSAVFAGGGETVDVSGAISVANITFQANGYTVADADNDGTLTVAGLPSVVTVVSSGDTGVVSEAIGGTGGLTKGGAGLLQLAGANTFAGVVRVAQGTLRLSKYNPTVLGVTGAGHGTVVENGATLDIYGAFTNNYNCAEELTLSGSGVSGAGALINTGVGCMNSGFSGIATLESDTTIGCYSRIDFRNTVSGKGHTLTKIGNSELAVGVAVTNCAVVINAGTYTYMHPLALGGVEFGTTVNGGALRSYGNQTVTEPLTFYGGSIIAAGSGVTTFKINGVTMLNAVVGLWTEASSVLELNGVFEGAGGLRKMGGGNVFFFSDNSTYSGPTLIDSGNTLYVGRTNLYAGVLGSGPVTNAGTLYGYSRQISQGAIVNGGTIYCNTGVLCGAGSVVNNGSLYVDRGGSFVMSNAFFGTGTTYLRYGGDMTVSGSASSNASVKVGMGTLTLTNGAAFRVYGEMQVADRIGMNYPVDPTNVTAVVNVTDGCTLTSQAITFGNGSSVTGGGMTGILNQTGGTVLTTGLDTGGEGNGIRLGHYPQANCVYNMSGGTLVVGKDADLGCATDGNGWFNMTGGEVFAKRVMLNERVGSGGYGRLTVAGGTLNLGSATGYDSAISNGIAADLGAPYLVEFGGAGGVIRAVTNSVVSVSNVLFGAGSEAVTFDTQAWTITMTNNSSGAGGLNKTGAGTLVMSGNNTYSGATRVLQGALSVASATALPAGGAVLFGVAAGDAGGRLVATGDLSLAGLTVGVADAGQLEKGETYTVATYGGALTALFAAETLPEPWYVYYDGANKRVQLKDQIGTLIRLR